jgi:hypothetical protein
MMKQLQARYRHGTSQRVRGEGMSVEESFAAVITQECLIDYFRRRGNAHRQIATGEGLRETNQVWAYAAMFAGKHFPCAAESRKDFIGDHQSAEFVAQPANPLEKLRRPHDQWLKLRSLKQLR